VTSDSTAGIFQTAGGGQYYLADGSTNRLAGTTNINAALLNDLKQKTTYPPLVSSHGVIWTNSVTLTNHAARENPAAPDLGYGYDPMDYELGWIWETNTITITVSPGTVIGCLGVVGGGYYGLSVSSGSQLVSQGTPTALNRFVEYSAVQEQRGAGFAAPAAGLVFDTVYSNAPAGIYCRFTDFSSLAQDAQLVDVTSIPVSFRDCQFHGGQLVNDWTTFNLTNCLLERVNVDLQAVDGLPQAIQNNLFFGGTFGFNNQMITDAVVKDNLFDRTAIPYDLTGWGYNGGHNAFVTNCNRMLPTNSTDLVLNAPAYCIGPLGDYYYPTNDGNLSRLIDHGSTNAGPLGLYHYTVMTNMVGGTEICESNSMVEIGYHHVAVDGGGNPIDTDGDGVPDFMEDATGDGAYGSGDPSNWLVPDCYPAGGGLVSWWRAEGNGLDSAGTNHGVWTGTPLYVPGMVGQAFNFTNIATSYSPGQKLVVPDSPSLKLTSLTIEGWIFARGPGYVLYRGDCRQGMDPYVVSVEADGSLQFLITSPQTNTASISNALTTSTWQHFAATFDGVSGNMCLYTNGVLAKQTSTSVRPLTDLTSDHPGIGIGGQTACGWDFPFNGMIDELSLWSRALSASEIAGMYNAGAFGQCTNCCTPLVQMLAPTNSQLFTFSPTNILLTASASSRIGAVTSLVFRANGSALPLGGIGTQTAGTNLWQYLWTNVAWGTNSITVTATNDQGIYASDSVTNVIVNAMPVVTILKPTSWQSNFVEVTNVWLSATNYDPDGTVTNVVFMCAGTNIAGTITSSNNVWTLIWSNRLHGTNAIIAVATDDRGATASSAIRVFSVAATNSSPTVSITFPVSNMVFRAGTNITIMATASNFPATITNVEFFVGNDFVGSDPAAPYSVTRCCWSSGSYTLRARATDSNGMSAVSLPVQITVDGSASFSGDAFWDPTFRFPEDAGGFYNIESLLVDGTNLYAGGYFNVIDMSASGVLRWNGQSWSSLGRLLMYGVFAIAENGTNLYAGGTTISGSDGPQGIAQWDGGTNWTMVASNGLGDYPIEGAQVYAMAVIGSDLYVGGYFTRASGNTNAHYIARLNHVTGLWESVTTNHLLNAPVYAIAEIGNRIFVGGAFTNAGSASNVSYVAELRGDDWVSLGAGVGGTNSEGDPGVVYALAGCGTNLFVGGDFTSAGGNTNANGVAIWNGVAWSTVQSGLAANTNLDSGQTNLAVYSISARGNSIFVGGQFRGNQPSPDASPAYQIARATWIEEQHAWVWGDLDVGVYELAGQPPADGSVLATAIIEGATANEYDVYVGGVFSLAGSGQKPAHNLARWSVGRAYPTNAPQVTLTFPTSGAVLTNPGTISLTATATADGSGVSSVEFFVDGKSKGTSYGPAYGVTWTNPAQGPHLAGALATDGNGLKTWSAGVPFEIVDTNANVQARDDVFTIFANSGPVFLPVLTNDLPAGALRVSDATRFQITIATSPLASVWPAFDGSGIFVEPLPNFYGRGYVWYSVTNGAGTADHAIATVNVVTTPELRITNPSPAGTNASYPLSLTISGTAVDWGDHVTSVQLYTNGVTYGSAVTPTSSNTFSAAWTSGAPGFYTFVAVGTDSAGYTNASPPVVVEVRSTNTGNHLPVAAITSPVAPVTNFNGRLMTNALTVRDGFLPLTGRAYDLDLGDPVSYQIVLLDPKNPTGPPLYNVTPGSVNAQGFHAGSVTNGSLGTVDLSVVENGAYLLTLVVHGGGDSAAASLLISLDSNLKIGQFSFSEQDLVLPVNGIPLTITRTYSSLNPRSGDFGYSWTMALNAMDVQLDDERKDVTIGTPEAPFADVEEDENGLPLVQSIRIGGGWDVTLTLPDGRRTTFAFTPNSLDNFATAAWTPPSDVHATLTAWPPGSEVIQYFQNGFGNLSWQDGGDNSTFDNHDITGWMLETLDGTKYYITRGEANRVVWYPPGEGTPIEVQAYGAPALTSIVQRTGDAIVISNNAVLHYAGSNGATTTNLTRAISIDRDLSGRITAIWDPNSQQSTNSNPLPLVRYIYNQDTGNLIQVQRLTDRVAGIYATNKYHYDNSRFPHYITRIENGLGVPVARNYYDDAGRLTAVVDANGNTNQILHNVNGGTTNVVEITIDRRGFTNSFAADARGNVIASTNAIGGITTAQYDDNNNKTNEVLFLNGQPYATNRAVFTNNWPLITWNPLGYSNVMTYNNNGQVLVSLRPCGCGGATNYYDDTAGNLIAASDALGNMSSNFFRASGLLAATRDPVGTTNANYWDEPTGNLMATAVIQGFGCATVPMGTVLSTNSYGYDDNGNRIFTVTWRRVGGLWVGATNTSTLDAQNRVIGSIDPLGYTNLTILDAAGQPVMTVNKAGQTNVTDFDFLGRAWRTTYPDGLQEFTFFDANGNATNAVNRAGHGTTNYFDNINRETNTIFADGASNRTIFDDLNRTIFTVDARGTTNAFGYDRANQRAAVTNGLGTVDATGAPAQTTNGFIFDINGNQVVAIDGLGHGTTNVPDADNRIVEVDFADGTKMFTGFDGAGHRSAETNQDGIVTWFGNDGAGRLRSVTNAVGVMTNADGSAAIVTRYNFDEAGNETEQIDALNRTNLFAADANGRRVTHKMPGGQTESWGYDPVGNEIRHTNFNGVVITNQFNVMNWLTNRSSIGGYGISVGFSPTGVRTNIVDMSGTTIYVLDVRDRLKAKTNFFNGGPTLSLSYTNDANGNVTDIASSSTNGVNLHYDLDGQNRVTNVLANGAFAAAYHRDKAGNVDGVSYGNGATSLSQFDALNRLTNSIWKSNDLTLASFAYKLGKTGNRTNLTETLFTSVTNRTYNWVRDTLYRLTTEAISGLGTNTYGLDFVGNRTNRTATIPGITNQSFTFNANDWQTTDAYDSNGNTTWSTNGSLQGPFYYNPEDRLTNFGDSVFFGYSGDGIRVNKSVGGTNIFFLVDDRNPTGYAQVLEEWAAAAGATNLSRVYNYGTALISQQDLDPVSHLPSSVFYFVPDGHGTTRMLVESGGRVANALGFDAYGTLIASNIAPQTAYLYTGQHWDADLGQYYLRRRLYGPGVGAFWTMDPWPGVREYPASLNKRAYCRGDPVSRVDFSGRTDMADVQLTMSEYRDIIGARNVFGLQDHPQIIRVDEAVTETISGGPAGDPQRSGTLSWRAMFVIRVDGSKCATEVGLRLMTEESDDVWNLWRGAIEAKWNGKFKLCCPGRCGSGMPLTLAPERVGLPYRPGYYAIRSADVTLGMDTWGTSDAYDVPHEVGHMLGNKDEYFTVDGVAYGPSRPGGNIMNYSGGEPEPRHFGLVARKVNPSCKVVRASEPCPAQP
jgi:RHS repeat-associated protein